MPLLNARELNESPQQSSNRWAINFYDWPEDRAKTYELPYEYIIDKVKPERRRRKDNGEFVLRKPLPQKWWQYNDKRPLLYHTIGRGAIFEKHPKGWVPNNDSQDYVIITGLVTKYFNPSFLKNNSIFSNKNAVFASSSFGDYAFWNSSIVQEWVWKYSGRRGESTLDFTPNRAVGSLPILNNRAFGFLDEAGKAYHQLRLDIMRNDQIGLTKLYNRFHDPEDNDKRVAEMRTLHQKIDEMVSSAYGWNGLKLEHDFYEVDYLPENDRVRFTFSEKARNEVLDRLTILNKQRFDEEQKESGVVSVLAGKKYKKSGDDRALDKVAEPKPQMDIFGKE